jgi:ribonuclease VapC
MFVDTSVIVAILSKEEDAEEWMEKLEKAPSTFTSALVILEATMRLSSKLLVDPREAGNIVERMLETSDIQLMPIDREEADLAVEAFARYGKGRGGPAQLNLSDCLSYACAKSHGVPLLYKGNDFSHTDLA